MSSRFVFEHEMDLLLPLVAVGEKQTLQLHLSSSVVGGVFCSLARGDSTHEKYMNQQREGEVEALSEVFCSTENE